MHCTHAAQRKKNPIPTGFTKRWSCIYTQLKLNDACTWNYQIWNFSAGKYIVWNQPNVEWYGIYRIGGFISNHIALFHPLRFPSLSLASHSMPLCCITLKNISKPPKYYIHIETKHKLYENLNFFFQPIIQIHYVSSCSSSRREKQKTKR